MRIFRRLRSALQRHGVSGFARVLLKNVRHYALRLVSGRLFRDGPISSEFDQAWGTDTESIREVGSLDDVRSENARHAVRYEPSPHRLVANVIGSLPLDPARFTFVDFGAGKGRVLLIAAGFPFSKVVGIEFSEELCGIANANIARLDPTSARAGSVVCLHQDATTYDLPEEPLVCYFYNPFDEVIMRAVIERLNGSLSRTPRDMFIVYINPVQRQQFDASDRWRLVVEDDAYLLYRATVGGTG